MRQSRVSTGVYKQGVERTAVYNFSTAEWLLDCPSLCMPPRQKLDCSVLIIAVALTRFLFRSHYLYDVDSVNFALAIGRFDPAVHQPHPPGYFLYVCLGRLVNVLFHNPNAALVAISIAASCGAAAMIYALANEWFGAQTARFAGLLFLFSPLAWFHGTVALTYIVEAFFSALIGYLCWRIYSGSGKWVLPGGLILGLAAGLRPSSLLFLGPLFLFSLVSAKLAGSVTPKRVLAGSVALLVALLAWFVPMLYASGGPAAYFASLSLLWSLSPGRQDGLGPLLVLSVARLCLIGAIFALCFGPAVVLFARPLCTSPTSAPRVKTFTWIWIAPALLFFTLVFLRFINSGYLLVVFPPVCVWLAFWASEWYAGVRLRTSFKAVLVGLAAAANVAIFLYAPVYCSYRGVRQFEAELENVQRALPQVASRDKSLIVGLDSHFLGFRHAGYYFPEYAIAEFPEFESPWGTRMFTMRDRDTRLVGRLATSGFTNFVLFPLPPVGNEYHQGLSDFRARFPANDLHTVQAAGCEFITGPIADLPLLFPVAARSAAPLYTAHHFPAPSVYRR